MIRPGRNKKRAKPQRLPICAMLILRPPRPDRKTTKKNSTLATDKGRIERYIKPLPGNLKATAVTRADIERFRDMVTEGATAAQIKTGKHGLARVTGGRGTAARTM